MFHELINIDDHCQKRANIDSHDNDWEHKRFRKLIKLQKMSKMRAVLIAFQS